VPATPWGVPGGGGHPGSSGVGVIGSLGEITGSGLVIVKIAHNLPAAVACARATVGEEAVIGGTGSPDPVRVRQCVGRPAPHS
jgi:hypothetical protein